MNPPIKQHKILIVDDVPENIDVLGSVLSEYKRIVALDGEKALQRARSESPPDLILLDIMMPDMDGYEVCRQLKADERTQDIPVIFVTAKDEEQDETRGFAVGAVDYISKPIKPSIVKVRVKTHLELQEARKVLKQQNQELIEAAQLRDDVERITRHDLKNPLNAIIGFPELIREIGELNQKQQEYLFRVEEAGLRMLHMINSSLDLFKMERGMYLFQPVSVDLVNVLRKITAELRPVAKRKTLVIDVMAESSPVRSKQTCMALGEELLCYSMLANLLKNALEASPEGEHITVKLIEADEAVVSIHNRGAVPEEIRGRFFEKYVTSGKKAKGTGLGTYSAKLIAETQGGRIAMTTSESEGTSVTVCLPHP